MGKAIKLKNNKTGDMMYPVTGSDIVFDPTTKVSVKDDLAKKIGEAPADGQQYARQDGAWVKVEAGAVSETALISLLPNNSELKGATVKVTTNEGETLLDTTWGGVELTVQVRAGLQYTVTVGDVEGFVKPEAVTYAAVKGATRSVSMVYTESRVQVNILSNQSNDTTIAAVKATVKYGSTSVETANGGKVSVPVNTEVTISFPAVEGYKKPDDITFTHTSGVSVKEGTYQTEVVKVTLSADNGESVNGQIVTINGTQHTWNGTAISVKIPYGTTYEVSVNDLSGYTTPAAQSFTASQSERNLGIVYAAITTGVFIQDIYGNLYTADEWDETTHGAANGVAVMTDNCSFVVGLSAGENMFYSAGGSNDNGVTKATSEYAAKSDYKGESNTDALIAQHGYEAEAAEHCRNFIFPNGQAGYLGAAGEWQAIIDNYVDFDSAYSEAGGAYPIEGSIYWTSTSKDNVAAWNANLSSLKLYDTTYKNEGYAALPFCPLTTPADYIKFTVCNRDGANSVTLACPQGITTKQFESSALNTAGISNAVYGGYFSTEWMYGSIIEEGAIYEFNEPG